MLNDEVGGGDARMRMVGRMVGISRGGGVEEKN